MDTWAAETAEAVRAARSLTGTEDSVHAALRTVREIALTYLRTPQPPGRSGRGAPAGIGDRGPLAAGGGGRRHGASPGRADRPPAGPTRRRGPRLSRSRRSARSGPRRRRSRTTDRPTPYKALRRLERLDDGTTLKLDGLHPADHRGEIMPRTRRRPRPRSGGRRDAAGGYRDGQEHADRSAASPSTPAPPPPASRSTWSP